MARKSEWLWEAQLPHAFLRGKRSRGASARSAQPRLYCNACPVWHATVITSPTHSQVSDSNPSRGHAPLDDKGGSEEQHTGASGKEDSWQVDSDLLTQFDFGEELPLLSSAGEEEPALPPKASRGLREPFSSSIPFRPLHSPPRKLTCV